MILYIFLLLLDITCVLALILWVINNPAIVGAAATSRKLPIYCVQRDNKSASLSFDAAWGNEDTEQIIDILNKYNIKATFFVVGTWVDKYPDSVKQLSDAGHEIMNHSDDHSDIRHSVHHDTACDLLLLVKFEQRESRYFYGSSSVGSSISLGSGYCGSGCIDSGSCSGG